MRFPLILTAIVSAALSLQTAANAQDAVERGALDDLVNSLAEQMDEDGTLDESAAEGLAELRSMADNPVDLNTATEADLARLIFLGERKARAIVSHRLKAGGIKTPQELMTIKCLSATDILLLRQVAHIGIMADSSTLRPLVKIDAICRAGRRWPLARGFKAREGKAAAYEGSALKTLLRVKAEIGGRLSFGLTANNDAGEPQMKNGSGLMDFYGGYASFTPARGPVRKVVAGHYNVRLGQGLGIWTGFGFDPTVTGVSPCRDATGVTPSLSAAESGYMRGAAIVARLLPWRMTAYASWVDADATTKLSADSSIFMTTIRTTGYHRTETERRYRHNDLLTTVGAHASADIGNGRIGIGANNWHTRIPMGRDGQPYRLYYPTGNDITTVSLDARVVAGRTHLFGEAATQGADAAAGVAGVDYDWGGGRSLSASIRRFGKRYHAQMQQPVCHTSKGGGESGAYLGLAAAPLSGLEVKAGFDAWKSRCLQRNVYKPAKGLKIRATAIYSITRRSELQARLRHSVQTTTTGGKEDWEPAKERSTSLKLIFKATPTSKADLSTMAERVSVRTAAGAHETGILIAQTAKLKTSSERLVVALSGSLFSTDSYAARTYTRRPMMLYDMAFAACYGKGATATAMITVKPADRLKIWLWCTHTRFTDRDKVGSGYEETNGPRRTDVKVQLQWKLWWHKRADLWPAASH